MTLLDHPLVGERYFFPRPDAPAPGRAWLVAVAGARLVCGRAGAHGGPALLHFHGNGEVVADWLGDFASSFDAAGIDTFFAEYRGYGGSTGKPALTTALDDALAVADATGRDPRELVVYGRSIGSLFALHVAAHRDVRAVVLESGIADLYERLALRLRAGDLGATDDELRAAVARHFDQRAKLSKVARAACPVLVLHAEHDRMVGKHHAERLAEWAGAHGELVLYPRGDHNTMHAFNGGDIVRRVIGVLRTQNS